MVGCTDMGHIVAEVVFAVVSVFLSFVSSDGDLIRVLPHRGESRHERGFPCPEE